MTTRVWRLFALISLPATWLAGQNTQLAGPISGYVFDRSARGLRPILGIPGSSLLGGPVDFGIETLSADVSPSQDTAFVTATDRTFHVFRMKSGTATELSLNGLVGVPDRIVFSPSGSSAALYQRGAIQIVSGLQGSPTVSAGLDVSAITTAGIPGPLALSDDGTALLLSSGSSVELFSAGADLGKLTGTAGPALVAFAPGRLDAAVLDARGAGMVLFHNLNGAVDSQLVAPPDDTMQFASALAFSPDGQRLYLANTPGQSVIAFDLAAGARSTVACSCSPSALTRVGNMFRLNELGSDPLWLLDSQPDAPRVLFVPAMAETEAKRQPAVIEAPRRPLRPLKGSSE